MNTGMSNNQEDACREVPGLSRQVGDSAIGVPPIFGHGLRYSPVSQGELFI
jgi:hypothetical protein